MPYSHYAASQANGLWCWPDSPGSWQESVTFKLQTMLGTTLFWAITQQVEVIPCRCFGTIYRSLFQGKRIHEYVPWVGYPETSVRFSHYTRHNSQEEPQFSYASWQKPEITHKNRVTCKGKSSWKFGKISVSQKKFGEIQFMCNLICRLLSTHRKMC